MQQQLFKVRDKRKKGWFYLDNEYLNGIGKHLGPIGIAVYVSLCRHADEDQKCFPSQKTIAEEIGAGERSIRSYLKKLEDLNIIKQEKIRQSGGQWLNNVYYLLDKTEWKYPEATSAYGKPEATGDTARGNRVQTQRQQVPTNNTNTNNTNKKNTNIAKQSFAGKDINDLIDLFQQVNPSWQRLFANKTQRASMDRLVKQHGREKIEWAISILPGVNKMTFAPTITTPLQLEDKLGQLIAFVQKEKIKVEDKKIIKI